MTCCGRCTGTSRKRQSARQREGLRRDYEQLRGTKLPKFPGVAAADHRIYAQYQQAATSVAREMYGGISRVHLDIYFWRAKDDDR